MPKVSVIMPVHNEPENYLRTAINSILKQTYRDFEFIIINDASENNAEEVILSYSDSRIRYYKNEENLKLIKTLNKGLKLVNGEYIARMDADDISFRTRFADEVEFLDNNSHIGLVNVGCYCFPPARLITPPTLPSEIEFFLKYSVNCIIHPAVMFRRSVIEENNLCYDENYPHIEDYKLWLDFCEVSKLQTLPKPLLLHREWGSSVSMQNLNDQLRSRNLLTFKSILKELNVEDEELVDLYKQSLYVNKISYPDFVKLDMLFSKAMDRVFERCNSSWKKYIIATLNKKRTSVLSTVVYG